MAEKALPLLRGSTTMGSFRAVVGGGGRPSLPRRDPVQHQAKLLSQLDAVLGEVRSRAPGQRDPEATREIVAIRPLNPDLALDPDTLSDRRHDVRPVGIDPATGVLLLDAPGPELVRLREKAAEFGEPKTRKRKDGTTTTSLAHEQCMGPVEAIDLARFIDWEGMRLRRWLSGEDVDLRRRLWFEVACRGGYRNPLEETQHSRDQVQRQLLQLGHPMAQEFVAPEDVSFFVRLSLVELRKLAGTVDCVYGYDLAPTDVLNWLLLRDAPEREIRGFAMDPPPADAPSVVILDSGVATEHPLLKPALLKASSILPGIDSPQDQYGHGTKMAGAALFEDLGATLQAGRFQAPYWIQSVRILVRPRQGTASDENREYWPRLTTDAVSEAERIDAVPRNRVYALAVTYPLDPLTPTSYTQAVDQLAFHDGKGRLLCVSAGNVAPEEMLDAAMTYPDGLILRKIQEPSHGSNVLTVGAYTRKTRLPPDRIYAEARPVAPAGGMAPHTTTGRVDPPWPIKPEIVMEGGNVALGSGLADPDVDTLVTLTTGHSRNLLARIAMTSEAAARAARMAAEVWRADPSLRPETVRGLLVHSASWTPTMRRQFDPPDLYYICGYGVPDLEFARACAANRATVVVEDEMPNAIEERRPKKTPPKRPTTPTAEAVDVRKLKVFRMPLPEDLLLADPDAPVELRVTLSYFAEPNTYRARVDHGLDLKWDMQGPTETEGEFLERINDLRRPRDDAGGRLKKKYKDSYRWEIGIQRRSRGTIQSDRWSGPASLIAGSRLIAVMPVLGWWDRRRDMRNTKTQPFSLIVTVIAKGIYARVKAELAAPVPVEV